MKNLNKVLSCLTIILLLASCSSDKQSTPDETARLHPAPMTVALNIEEGYIINPLTGDSIQPVINSLGDTIKTGAPVPAIGKVINPENVAQPRIIPAGEPEVIPINLNVHKIPESLTIIPVNKDLLKTFTPGLDTSSFVLVNSMGDTVSTGVPIPVKGKVVPCKQPKPVKALPPRMKENASLNMKYLDVDQGMNSAMIRSLLEDNRGNIWFATWGGAGVCMYNGESFTYFTENEGLVNNFIHTIMEDSHGNLWIGTGRGVSMYNGETFTHFTEKEGLSDNHVLSILEDRNGNLWFGTRNGVSIYNGETFTHFTVKEGLSNNNVKTILEDRNGNLWFGTFGGGVSMYNGETFTHFTKKEGLSNDFVLSILEDRNGNLWFGTSNGVSMYNGETFTHFTENEGLSSNYVGAILEDRDGNLWFGTGGGVSLYNGKTFTNFTENEGLSNNNVTSILEDRNGNLWFGTNGGGISIYRGKTFTNFTENEGLSSNHVWSILEDSHLNLWFGSGRGVSMYNDKTLMHFTVKEGFIWSAVLSILEDRNGNIWIGTAYGVCMYNGESFAYFTEKEGLSNDFVLSILEDSHCNLWFSTWGGGVSMYNGETFTHFTEKEGLINNVVWSILEDRNGNLWFGTDGGVSMYNGETFTHFTQKEGLSINGIGPIVEDSHGNLWFGTFGGGVSIYNGKSFTHFTQKEGLSNNYVWSILEDSNSNIWLGTDRELNRLAFSSDSDSSTMNSLSPIDVKEDNAKFTFFNPVMHTYGEQDGLKALGFNFNSVILDSKNRIWWGSGKGLEMLEMNNFKIPVEPPTTMQLNRIEINGQFLDYRNLKESAKKELDFNGVARFYNYPLILELPYKSNHLSFYFSAIDWAAPHKLSYQYILKGFDRDWSQLTSENKAEYRKIPPGSYTFKVRAIGVANIWSDTMEYSFIVHPPWNRTILAYIIYGLILLAVIFGFIRWRIWSFKKDKDELEKQVKKRTKQIEHQKEEIVSQRDELEKTLKSLKITQTQLVQSEKMASLGGLVAGVAHEINTPVGIGVTAVSSLLEDTRHMADLYKKEQISRGDFKEFLQTTNNSARLIQKNLDRTAQLVQSFKQVSVDQSSEEKREFLFKEYLEDVIRSLYPKFKNRDIRIIIDCNEKLKLNSFPGVYAQIFTNLVLNSITHGFPGEVSGRIDILVKQKNKELSIEYKDNGKGIPKDILPRIFDPFFTTDQSKGTGLGLNIVYNLVTQKLNGTIKCHSKDGKGVVFGMMIPLGKNEI